jgi:hypothetical protein
MPYSAQTNLIDSGFRAPRAQGESGQKPDGRLPIKTGHVYGCVADLIDTSRLKPGWNSCSCAVCQAIRPDEVQVAPAKPTDWKSAAANDTEDQP